MYVCIYFPRWLKAIGVLTSNKEGKVICEIDGWMLRGMQLGALVQVLFGGLGDSQVCFCEIDGKILGGMQFGDSCAGAVLGCCCGVLLEVLSGVYAGVIFLFIYVLTRLPPAAADPRRIKGKVTRTGPETRPQTQGPLIRSSTTTNKD